MTATAHSAPSLQELAPHIVSKVRDGDLGKAQLALLLIGIALIGGAWATGGKSFHAASFSAAGQRVGPGTAVGLSSGIGAGGFARHAFQNGVKT